MEQYSCKECGAPAEVKGGEVAQIIRSCEHTGVVLLNMSVHCTGESSFGEVNPLFKLFHKIGLAILKKMKEL